MIPGLYGARGLFWGAEQFKDKSIFPSIHAAAFGGNIGHAAMFLYLPNTQEMRSAVDRYCKDDDGNVVVPHRIEKRHVKKAKLDDEGNVIVGSETLYEEDVIVVYSSWWPPKETHRKNYFNTLQEDHASEYLGVHYEWDPILLDHFQPSPERHMLHGFLGNTLMTYGPKSIAHQRDLDSKQLQMLEDKAQIFIYNRLLDNISSALHKLTYEKYIGVTDEDFRQLDAQDASWRRTKWGKALVKDPKIAVLKTGDILRESNMNPLLIDICTRDPDVFSFLKLNKGIEVTLDNVFDDWRGMVSGDDEMTSVEIDQMCDRLRAMRTKVESEQSLLEDRVKSIARLLKQLSLEKEEVNVCQDMIHDFNRSLNNGVLYLEDIDRMREFETRINYDNFGSHIKSKHKQDWSFFIPRISGDLWLDQSGVDRIRGLIHLTRQSNGLAAQDDEFTQLEVCLAQATDGIAIGDEMSGLLHHADNYFEMLTDTDALGALGVEELKLLHTSWRDICHKQLYRKLPPSRVNAIGSYLGVINEHVGSIIKGYDNEIRDLKHRDIDPDNYQTAGLSPDDEVFLPLMRDEVLGIGHENGLNPIPMLAHMRYVADNQAFHKFTNNCANVMGDTIAAGIRDPHRRRKFQDLAYGTLSNPQICLRNSIELQNNMLNDTWYDRLERRINYSPLQTFYGWSVRTILSPDSSVAAKTGAVLLNLLISPISIGVFTLRKLLNPLKTYNQSMSGLRYAYRNKSTPLKVAASIALLPVVAVFSLPALGQKILKSAYNGIKRLFSRVTKPSIETLKAREQEAFPEALDVQSKRIDRVLSEKISENTVEISKTDALGALQEAEKITQNSETDLLVTFEEKTQERILSYLRDDNTHLSKNERIEARNRYFTICNYTMKKSQQIKHDVLSEHKSSTPASEPDEFDRVTPLKRRPRKPHL